MKTAFFPIFRTLLAVIIILTICSWSLDFDQTIVELSKFAMFSVIGAFYIIGAFLVKEYLLKILFISCGLFLVIMNFIPQSLLLTIIGICSILLPPVVAKFSPEFKDTEEKN
ncbi:hypothetical protein [Chryseobacterium sp.]|uniref:hypothetical protein n=1 Tax=Chryseobacterium sp. TaxID=1871047 RepID=UPI0011CBF7EC|nr:hypothetical protein [Chryseobacterium sp.]TXF74886.1 hypothetical protein FUA25_11395 [Chryseobacterium sp.]